MPDDDFRTITLPPSMMPQGFTTDEPREIDLGSPDDPDDGELSDGALKIEIGEDGAVEIDLDPQPKSKANPNKGGFGDNLALELDGGYLTQVGSMLIDAIERDDQSRQEWMDTRAAGIELLGIKLEDSGRTDAGSSAAPLEGMATVRHPLLLEAVVRFQSNAAAELLPAAGPVKVRNDQTPQPENDNPGLADQISVGHNGGPPMEEDGDELAEALEKDLNFYLTSVDRGYRADFDRMLFWVGFGGCGFRKVYHDPIRRMPLSRSVDAKDLIVNHSEVDFDDCRRVTHRIRMRKSQVKRMQLAGAYRDVPLQQPIFSLDAVTLKEAEVQGIDARNTRPEDTEHTILECYCELDIPGFGHKDEDGNETGLELPYRVTMDKDSRVVLEIRRNWREDDPECLAKKSFVKYPFVPMFGFYEIGLLQMLGNATRALTGAWRMALDSSMFASFPGFLYSDMGGRQPTNDFRVPPGGGVKVNTGGLPITSAIMPLPYKDATPGLVNLIGEIESTAQRVGGTAEMQVGEGKQDAPVGTTLALIEQAMKVLSAVHVRLHAAQCEEFQMLRDLFREDPTALWRKNKGAATRWQEDQFLAALEKYDLVPSADPNNPSHMQRVMKAIAIKQLQAMNPALYNALAVDRRILSMIGLTDIDHLFNNNPPPPPDPNAPPPGDPTKMAAIQAKVQAQQQQGAQKLQELQFKQQNQQAQSDARQQELAVESADRAADRASRERVAQIREETERVKVDGELAQHQQPSGNNMLQAQTTLAQHHTQSADAMADAHASMVQHHMPSGDALASHHAALVQHHIPSGDAQVGAGAALAQHHAPSGDAKVAAAANPPGPDGGATWKRPI